jgi:hypothetical protein
MSTKIQVRRGTAAQWTAANPTLDSGEIGFETDTGKFKIGNVRNIIQTVVTGGTNVVYTTGVAHGLVATDYVTITGITTAQGLPASNPVQITAVTSTTFTAAVTTGTTGTYTSLTGIATSPWNSSLYASDHSDFVGVLTGFHGGTGVANTGKTITLGGSLTTSGAFDTTLTTTGTTGVTLPTSGTLLSTAAVVTGAQGGTGVANTGKTITVSGNTAIGSSTHTVTLNTTAATSVTLPTSGTLATLTGSEALTTKTYNGLSLATQTTGFTVAGGSITSKTLTVNNSYTLSGADVTLSLAGNLTTSGAFATTLTTTGTTSVTLPTSGTLINSAFPARLVAELIASTGAIGNNAQNRIVGFTAPANTLIAGDTFRFTGYATRAGTGAGTTTFVIRIGPTTLTGNIPFSATSTSIVTGVWKFEALVTIRTTGVSGTVGGVGKVDITSTLGTNAFTTAVAVNTTVANEVEATINSGVAGNTYTFEYAILEKLNT